MISQAINPGEMHTEHFTFHHLDVIEIHACDTVLRLFVEFLQLGVVNRDTSLSLLDFLHEVLMERADLEQVRENLLEVGDGLPEAQAKSCLEYLQDGVQVLVVDPLANIEVVEFL